jgi:hypothetical protein
MGCISREDVQLQLHTFREQRLADRLGPEKSGGAGSGYNSMSRSLDVDMFLVLIGTMTRPAAMHTTAASSTNSWHAWMSALTTSTYATQRAILTRVTNAARHLTHHRCRCHTGWERGSVVGLQTSPTTRVAAPMLRVPMNHLQQCCSVVRLMCTIMMSKSFCVQQASLQMYVAVCRWQTGTVHVCVCVCVVGGLSLIV